MKKNNLLLDELRELISRGDAERLRKLIGFLHPEAVARLGGDLNRDEQRTLLGALEPRHRAQVFGRLGRDVQLELFETLEPDQIAEILNRMPHDDRVDLLQSMPDRRADELKRHLSTETQRDIEKLGKYAQGTVGSVMTSEFAALRNDMTVEDALRALRSFAEDVETVYYLFVLNAQRQLKGVLTLRDLLVADTDTVLHDLMRTEVVSCQAGEGAEVAARLLKDYDLIALPVINGGDEMVGIVTFDDVIDYIEEEASETMYKKAGVADLTKSKDHIYSEKLTQGSIWYPIRVRMLFLFITLIGGLIVGGVIDFFEDTLEAVLAAAIFIPLIMDMGGNVGTQSTTIFARGYALGHINLKQFFRSHLFREGGVGLIMGAVLGVLGGLAAYFWQGAPNGIPQLGFAVGISLFTVTTVATMLGFLLPWILLKIGVDHAPGADPFLTTIKDFTGLALYFVLIAWLIGVPDEAIEDALAEASTPAAIVSAEPVPDPMPFQATARSFGY
ncbi:MAG: magnesium transporter [Phycisphaerales bacterium]|nr:MAG: magnesium transporter [Phycisphaerales bacterium]